MNHKAYVFALAVWLGLAGLPVQAQSSNQADYIVAVVNSEPITNSDVRAALTLLVAQIKSQKQALPPMFELQQVVLDRLINERAQLQVAAESGIKIDDATLNMAEENVARQNQISVAELHQRLVKEGSSVKAFRAQLRDQLTLTRLREREVEARVRVSDQDVEQYLAEDQAKNNDPLAQNINIAQVLIAVPEKASPSEVAALSARANQVWERARSGEDFAALVQAFSSADKANGGQLGLRRADRYPQLFVNAIQNVAAGGIANVVRSPAGFHILKLVERNAAPGSKTMVQSHARHILLRTSPQMSQSMAIERLNDYRQRVVSGKGDFQALAREFSQDGSAAQGGDLGWAGPGMFVPEFEEVMNRLRDGEISQPLVSRFGVHLIQLIERRQVELSARDLRESVRAMLKESKQEEAYINWAKDIRERAFVEMREPPR